ncbi:MAG: acyl-CoA dehydrogenase family protein [Polyangia bacterium]
MATGAPAPRSSAPPPLRERLEAVLPVAPGPSPDSPRRAALLEAVVRLPELSEADPQAPHTALKELAAAGLLAECVPQAFGGAEPMPSLRALCTVRAALAYRAPLYDLMFVMQGLGSYAVTRAGTGEMRRAYLPAVASGRAIAAVALTEPEAGSDLAGIRTRAARTDDGYVLDGEKVFISNAGLATHYVFYARTDEHPKKGLTALLVPADSPGLSVEPMALLCDDHPIGRLRLVGVRLPASARIGDEGQGMTLALTTLELFRPSVGAAAVGMARRALDEALAHVQRRQQFGQPLASFQATQLALAEMATDVEAAALLVGRAAALADAGAATGPSSAMAKLFATEAAQRTVDRALQLLGGVGLVRGSVTERLYRDVRALRIYEGTSEIQKLIIARGLLTSRR